MSTSTLQQPDTPLSFGRSYRVEAIDVLRGLLMILMALDHTRDYFSNAAVDPADPVRSWPALFFTRWITHLCAPGFILLAGTSVYLQRQRKSAAVLTRTLVLRGLWFIVLEFTVISFGWSFGFGLPLLQVIWVIGASMVVLAGLQWLPSRVVAAFGLLLIFCHNLLDPIRADKLGAMADAWKVLHERGLLSFHGHPLVLYGYPLIPWVGVMALGYGFGEIATEAPAARQRTSAFLCATSLGLFSVLRLTHGYGDPGPGFTHLQAPGHSVMSFLSVEKYPPSLHYLLATLGVVLLLFALFDRIVTADRARMLRAWLRVYGCVPFFFYILHIFAIHGLALVIALFTTPKWRFWITPDTVFLGHLEGWGWNLPVVYLVWAAIVFSLYPFCVWFSRYKDQHRHWWLTYL